MVPFFLVGLYFTTAAMRKVSDCLTPSKFGVPDGSICLAELGVPIT
jgi:hypothetical protein